MIIDKKMTRRDFVKSSAALGAGVGLSHIFPLRAFSQDNQAEYTESGEWKPTTCQGCTSWCSVQAYVVDGRAIKVRGNPNSKVNGEATCPRSHISLQQVYDPDRVKVPMKRTNPNKGRGEDPQFVPISWDEAFDTIADRILDLRETGESHKYLLMRGRYSYMRGILYDRMTKIIGSPNNISHSAICAEAEKFGPYYTEGLWAYRQYDVENTRYMLIWGADPLATNRQVSYYMSAWGDVLDRAEVAVVDPRFSVAASKADHWLPIKPGADGALAVAIAHVILTEGLWYREFVGDFTDGVNKFVLGKEVSEDDFTEKYTHGLVKWWNIELKDKTPQWAAGITGLPEEQIVHVARGFAKAAPHAMCWVGGGPVMQVRGAYLSMATHALNGLVGAVDNEGGTLAPNKEYSGGFPAPDDYMDDISKAGVQHEKIDQRGRLEFPAIKKGKPGSAVVTNNTAQGILDEDPYDIKVAIGYFNNFAFSCPGSERWERALSKLPFFVHITTNASEMSWFADVILPSGHHMYEKWGFVKTAGHGHRHVTLLEPVNRLVWDVKTDETEIPWLLAEKLAEKGFPNLIEHYREYRDPETGKIPENESEFALFALKHATQKLWDPRQYAGGDRINGWEDFAQRGVWNSDPYPYRDRWGAMKTKTGNFEFYSETLKEALTTHAENHNTTVDRVMEACNYQARGEKAFVPHHEDPYVPGDREEYPFEWVEFKSRLSREGRSANCSWYHEFHDVDLGNEAWEDMAMINPQDGEKMGIESGDKIRISSPSGSIECKAKMWEGLRPGTVAKSFGNGHWAYGRMAALEFGKTPRGGNNNVIIPAEYERLSGSSVYYSVTNVKVEKIS